MKSTSVDTVGIKNADFKDKFFVLEFCTFKDWVANHASNILAKLFEWNSNCL